VSRLLRRWPALAVVTAAFAAGSAVAAAAPSAEHPAPAQHDARVPSERPAEYGMTRRAAHRAAAGRVRVLIRAARSRIGSPYVWGATGPHAFDCSGLTQWSLRRAGVHIARTSSAQSRAGTAVRRWKVRAGDLVFFSTAGPGASHVGIATGRHTAISATSHGVRAHSFSDAYWGGSFFGARRVVRG
jgi:cell wall-associated NlpC family hydrolase